MRVKHLSFKETIVFICLQGSVTHKWNIVSEWEADGSALVPHTGCWNRVSSQLKATSGSLYSTSSIRLIFQMSSWTRSNGHQTSERVAKVCSVSPPSVLSIFTFPELFPLLSLMPLSKVILWKTFCLQLSPKRTSPYLCWFPRPPPSFSKVFS